MWALSSHSPLPAFLGRCSLQQRNHQETSGQGAGGMCPLFWPWIWAFIVCCKQLLQPQLGSAKVYWIGSECHTRTWRLSES